MARVEPLKALTYDLEVTGGLAPVISPPYDVIDEAARADLLSRSPFNIVEIDLPIGDDPYGQAAATLSSWIAEGVIVRDAKPAIWAVEQIYTSPAGDAGLVRKGFLARIAVEQYGEGKIRPHERTHAGPKEDRLRLTRATQANLSPIFALYSDPEGTAAAALADGASTTNRWDEVTTDDGALTRIWRIDDQSVIAAVCEVASESELLIADGHHRYETARVFLEEEGSPAGATHVLAYLVALEDPGLVVFPTHRLVKDLTDAQWQALDSLIEAHFESVPMDAPREPSGTAGQNVEIGFVDSRDGTTSLLKLRDPATAAEALPGRCDAYRELDTGVLEAMLLHAALGLDEERIDRLEGFGYARDLEFAVNGVRSGEWDAAFLMGPTPVERIRAIASAGENMPPKSTYFYPKIPTGLLINPLGE